MVRAPCELFVPTVRGSTLCSICDRQESDHTSTSPYSMKESSSSNSPRITPSENSAFTAYRKDGEGDPSDTFPRRTLTRRPPPENSRNLVVPKASKANPLMGEKHSDSNIRRRILDKQRPRSNSVGTRLDEEAYSSSSPSPSPTPMNNGQRKSSRRAKNFHEILTRFQSASEAAQSGRPQRRITVGTVRLGSPAFSGSPADSRRSSLHENSPSRTNSSRAGSERRQTTVPSPISHYLPEATIRSASHFNTARPNKLVLGSIRDREPVLLPDRPQPISPLSDDGRGIERPVPLTIAIPSRDSRRRNPLPSHWVKETDIDDPASFSNDFPLSSPESDPRTTFINPIPVTILREAYEKKPSHPGSRRMRDFQNNHVFNGKRSRSREGLFVDEGGSNGHDTWRDGASSVVSRSSTSPALTASRAKAIETNYAQICTGHVNTLSWVAEKLNEQTKISPNSEWPPRFGDLSLHRSPTLIKGTSFFFDGTLTRGREVQEVTVMIAPHSHYAPVLRRGFGVTTIAEIEDDEDENIAKFVSAYTDEEFSTVKAVIMPRFKLCSLHSLAAQHMHRLMNAEDFEAHVCFILIRLLSALKLLQSDGIESLSTNFREFLLVYRPAAFRTTSSEQSKDVPQLLFLPDSLDSSEGVSDSEQVGLCRYALRALCTLLHHRMDSGLPHIQHNSRHSRALLAAARTLLSDKSSSLSTSKQLLELSLFAHGPLSEGDWEARMWLDARRAECVNQLLRSLVDSASWTEKERIRVDFLLSATPRSMTHAVITLDNTHID